MTVAELLVALYAWADARAPVFLVVAVVVPAVGTALAWIGKGGRSDREGRLVASLLVGFGIIAVILAIIALAVAHVAFDRGVLDANLVLLVSPLVCLAGCLLGARWLFPLNELASVKTFADVGFFVLACAVVLWLFSKFRGWGIVFWGDLVQLAVIGALGYFLLRRLYRRAFGRHR